MSTVEMTIDGLAITVEIDDDKTHDPFSGTYSVYLETRVNEGLDSHLGDVLRNYNAESSYHQGSTYWKRTNTKDWDFDFNLEFDDLDPAECIDWATVNRHVDGHPHITYRTAVKHFVRAWVLNEQWVVKRKEKASQPAPADPRFSHSPTPSVASFEADPANRTECPHPECLSRAENCCHGNSINSRVVVDGGEDYCIHHSCTWTEDQGEHFALSADVCPICNRLTLEHGLHEARDCLQSLIREGMPTEFDANKTVSFEVIE
jgi:hypothetical protein